MGEDEVKDWIVADDNEPTSESLTDEQIIAHVREEVMPRDDEVSDDDDDEEEPTPCVPMKEAVEALEKAYTAFERCNSQHISEMQLINFRSLILAGKQAQRENSKQMTLYKFFVKKNHER